MKTGNETKMIKRDQNVYSILTANDRRNFLTRLTRSRIFKEVRKEFKWVKTGLRSAFFVGLGQILCFGAFGPIFLGWVFEYYTQCTVKLRSNFEKIAQLKCTTNEKRNLSEHDDKNFKLKNFL